MQLIRTSVLLISAFALSGCFSILPLRIIQKPTPSPSLYRITEVVDAVTGEKITGNQLVITIERPEQDTLQFVDKNIQEFNVDLPIGTRVLILIEAPGYQDWEVEFIFGTQDDFEGPVKMQPAEPGFLE